MWGRVGWIDDDSEHHTIAPEQPNLLIFSLLYFALLFFTLQCFTFSLFCFTLLCFTLLYVTSLYFALRCFTLFGGNTSRKGAERCAGQKHPPRIPQTSLAWSLAIHDCCPAMDPCSTIAPAKRIRVRGWAGCVTPKQSKAT